jgi:tripartite-type tricarboxylate transporter receptor subunit TctC
VPVAGVGRGPNVMVVAPEFPAKTVPEFIAYAKAHPGQISMASAGVGSESHMCGELFKLMAGVGMVHVPYRGQAPALTDLIGGQVQADFAPLPPSIEYAKAGKLRALAITSSARSERFPDLPTVAEFLPGYEATLATGLAAPRGTPAEIIERINKEANAALADPRIKTQLADLGNAPLPGSPADFGSLIAAEVEKWAKVIRAANLKPE